MTYLITQTFVLLLIAGLLGWVLGWYLTRLSAANGKALLQARLRACEEQQRALREELDAATTARENAQTERRLLSDELNRLRAVHDSDEAQAGELHTQLEACREALTIAENARNAMASDCEGLQAELDSCRAALQDAIAPALPDVEREVDSKAIASAAAAAASGALGLMGSSPPAAGPIEEGEPDDLQQISGIGPKIAGILRDLGIQRFEQIAAWTPEEVEAINARLKFKGRIEREAWIPQAKALSRHREGS